MTAPHIATANAPLRARRQAVDVASQVLLGAVAAEETLAIDVGNPIDISRDSISMVSPCCPNP